MKNTVWTRFVLRTSVLVAVFLAAPWIMRHLLAGFVQLGLLAGLLLAGADQALSQAPQPSEAKALAPITATQRDQIGLSLQALGTSLASLETALAQCSKSTPSAACVQQAQHRDTIVTMRENLCKQYHVRSGDYGCP